MKDSVFQSRAYGKRENKVITMEGRVQFDLFQVRKICVLVYCVFVFESHTNCCVIICVIVLVWFHDCLCVDFVARL